MFLRGTASGKRVNIHMIVSKYWLPAVPIEADVSNGNDQGQQNEDLEPIEEARMSTRMLVNKQENDPVLQKLKEQAISEDKASKIPVCCYVMNNVLMRKWRPREVSSSHEWRVIHQVVVPPIYCPEILQLAHAIPLAGYLGVNKTCKRILNHFYWPGIRKDVKRFCKTCDSCQKVEL